MSAKKYLVRFMFRGNDVTMNTGTAHEFKTSLIDFYTDSLDEAYSIDPTDLDNVDLSKASEISKGIWKRNDCNKDLWVSIDKCVIDLKNQNVAFNM